MATRFDRWASTYDDSALQPVLFVPVHQTVLHLAQQLLPRPGRLLDVGCGTGRLLRHARQRYPGAELVGVDLAGRMLEAAVAATPTELAIRYVHACAEQLPFTDELFQRAIPEHQALVAAVADGDPDTAADVARTHFTITTDALRTAMTRAG